MEMELLLKCVLFLDIFMVSFGKYFVRECVTAFDKVCRQTSCLDHDS